MGREILAEEQIHSAIRQQIESNHADLLNEVKQAIAANDVVVVGMAQNPHVKRVRKLLAEKNINCLYLEYGSYFSLWRRRLALKMWTGWSTFPMVFVKGTLIGGADQVDALLNSGELSALINRQERGAA